MSWHHHDYISLFAAIGGVVSAASAAYAAIIAKDAAESSARAQLRAEQNQKIASLNGEMVNLAARCNDTVGFNSLVFPEHNKLVELATALTIARQAIDSSLIDDEDKAKIREFFIRLLRPGVIGEIERAKALFETNSFTNDVLRHQYRDAQDFLDVENPVPLPDPVIMKPRTT